MLLLLFESKSSYQCRWNHNLNTTQMAKPKAPLHITYQLSLQRLFKLHPVQEKHHSRLLDQFNTYKIHILASKTKQNRKIKRGFLKTKLINQINIRIKAQETFEIVEIKRAQQGRSEQNSGDQIRSDHMYI